MSEDFIEDAVESLDLGGCRYILLAASPGSSRLHCAAQIGAALEFEDFKMQMLKFISDLEQSTHRASSGDTQVPEILDDEEFDEEFDEESD